MTTIPTSDDHILALQLFERPDLTDSDRVLCGIISLAAQTGDPVLPETMARFRTLSAGESAA